MRKRQETGADGKMVGVADEVPSLANAVDADPRQPLFRDARESFFAEGAGLSRRAPTAGVRGAAPEFAAVSRRRRTGLVLACCTALVALFVVALGIGRSGMSPVEVVGILGKHFFSWAGSYSQAATNIVIDVRLPRVVAALLVGAALAISGASYQGLLRNPMVSPDILGASAGAAFGAASALLFNLDSRLVQCFAFAAGFAAVALAYFSARRIGRGANQVLLLVLCGLIVGTLFQAFVSVIKYTADPDSKLPEITYWLMGSIAKVTWSDLAIFLIPFLIGGIPLVLLRWQLNALSLGDEEAESLGVNVALMRGICILCATLLTSAVVSIAGVVGWVGLVIPHLVRFMFGPDNRVVLPLSLVVGGGFMILVDMACRSLMASEIPLGILTSVIGAPFFFVILLKAHRGDR